MSLHRIVPAFAVVLALGARDAQAFFDPPWITPATPRQGEIVSVNIRGGVCDSIFEHPGFPEITQQGNAIRIVEYGHHWDTDDLCIYPVGTLTGSIGTFPPGDYTLTVDFIYDDYLYGPTVMNLGFIPFTVNGATLTAPVTAISTLWQFMLLVLISSAAANGMKLRQQNTRPKGD